MRIRIRMIETYACPKLGRGACPNCALRDERNARGSVTHASTTLSHGGERSRQYATWAMKQLHGLRFPNSGAHAELTAKIHVSTAYCSSLIMKWTYVPIVLNLVAQYSTLGMRSDRECPVNPDDFPEVSTLAFIHWCARLLRQQGLNLLERINATSLILYQMCLPVVKRIGHDSKTKIETCFSHFGNKPCLRWIVSSSSRRWFHCSPYQHGEECRRYEANTCATHSFCAPTEAAR